MHSPTTALVVAGLAAVVLAAPADAHRDVVRSKNPPKYLRAGNGVPVRTMLARAIRWDRARASYLYGGGHAVLARPGQAVDCSGFTSGVVLRRGKRPLTSGAFVGWGKPGRGRNVTVLANGGHVLFAIRQGRRWRWFATSYSNPGGGAGEIARPSAAYQSAYAKRHPS